MFECKASTPSLGKSFYNGFQLPARMHIFHLHILSDEPRENLCENGYGIEYGWVCFVGHA